MPKATRNKELKCITFLDEKQNGRGKSLPRPIAETFKNEKIEKTPPPGIFAYHLKGPTANPTLQKKKREKITDKWLVGGGAKKES